MPGGTRPRGGITCRRIEGGGFDLRLAAAHRKPFVLTVIGLTLTGMAAGLLLAPAPGLMRILTISFGALVLLPAAFLDFIAAWLWLVGQEVRVRGASVLMRRTIGPFHWDRTFEGGCIAEITCKADGSSSTSNGATVTYHGIQLLTRDGKSAWLASNIADGDYAAWLTEEINAARAGDEPPGRELIDASTESPLPPG